MVWYALIPIAETNPVGARVARREERAARDQQVHHPASRRGHHRPARVRSTTLIAAAATRSEDYQSDVVDGLTLGLQGQQGVAKPAAWDAFAKKAGASADAGLGRQSARAGCVARQRRSARRRRARSRSMVRRRRRRGRPRCSRSLDARAPDLRQIAEQLLKVRTVNGVAATRARDRSTIRRSRRC